MEDMVVHGHLQRGSPGLVALHHVYTAVFGDHVIPGSVSDTRYDHYDLLRTIEELLGLGTLGR